jgi:hypothetical protein
MKKVITEFRSRLMIWAIRQWSENEMDQFDHMYIKTKWGNLYIHLTYEVENPKVYNEVK